MSEKRGLSHTAYGGINGEDYIPYIPVTQAMPEMTWVSIIMGCFLAILFGAANTYLGLKIGMTIAAGLPAAIIATGILKGIFRRNNILETNMIQAMASMGESLAGGLIFIVPACILLGRQLSIPTIVLISLLGGLLGILFVVPLRKYLIVEEHGKLVYPEGMAASEVLVSSSAGGEGFKTMITGVSVGGIYKLFSGGFKFWMEEPDWVIKPVQGTIFGIDVYASLVGVGYIVGIEIGMYMFAGALVAWFGLIPLIKYVGAGLAAPLFPATANIADMGAWDIWKQYIKYIGAGAVAAGGFISIIKSMPTIIKSFKSAMSGIGEKGGNQDRTNLDVPMTWVIAGSVLVFFVAWLVPVAGTRMGIVGAILAVIFSFFFAVVSARLVGLIGTSNNPISGMTIATLLFVTAILKATGHVGNDGMIAAIVSGSIVCVATAIAGGAAQSLKTTFIIGGTPKRLQIGMYIAIALSAIAVGYVIILLDATYHIGSKEVAAPQASLMSMVVKGIMTNQLPWALVIIGITFGLMCEMMKIPVLPFALGLYLPIHLSTGVVLGGVIRVLVDKRFKNDESALKERTERGILLSSGLVAGDALVGIVIALFAYIQTAHPSFDIAFGPKILPTLSASPWTSAVLVALLSIWMYRYTVRPQKK